MSCAILPSAMCYWVKASPDMAALMNAEELPDGLSLADQVAYFEKALIGQALNRYNGNIKQVMEALDIPRKTLSDKMRKYGLERRQFRAELN